MIYILDDEASFTNLSKQCDTAFLEEPKYKEILQFSLCHSTDSINQIKEKLSKSDDIIFYHKSLQPKGDNNEEFVETLSKFRNFLINNEYNYLVFSLGVNSNIKGNSIDKLRFYKNLKVFLDNVIENKTINLSILYYGKNYEKIDRLSLLYTVLTKIDTVEFKRFPRENAFRDFIADASIREELSERITKGEITKSEVIDILNNLA